MAPRNEALQYMHTTYRDSCLDLHPLMPILFPSSFHTPTTLTIRRTASLQFPLVKSDEEIGILDRFQAMGNRDDGALL